MPSDPMFDYEPISAALSRIHSTLDASEYHGTLCGILCAGPAQEYSAWLEELFRSVEFVRVQEKESKNILEQCAAQTLRQLKDPEYRFHPLLPNDKLPLQTRTEAISHWCQGFLMGLSIAGIKQGDKLPEEAAEIVRDLAEVSRAGMFQVEDSNENEADYTELVEYLRAAVLLVYEEFHALRRPAVLPSSSIH